VPSLYVVGLGPVVARARVLADEVFRVEKFADRRFRVTVSITPGSSSMSTARGTYLPPEASWLETLMRSSYASLWDEHALAAAADAVLVERHLPKLCAHLVTALARLHVHNHARK
jgi:hypothetical protein